jgi:hypothetical protein
VKFKLPTFELTDAVSIVIMPGMFPKQNSTKTALQTADESKLTEAHHNAQDQRLIGIPFGHEVTTSVCM